MNILLPTLRRRGMVGRPAWDIFDRFFEDFRWPSVFTEETAWMPPFDVSETDDVLIVKLEVPGMDKKDININLSEGMLTVTGERKQEKEEHETYHCTERYYGTFSRSICLPFEVNADKVDASFKDGVLKITLPRSEAVKPKKIEVH
ncbi:MAG: Hsp20/alpha crystallin family protein [Desulfobacterales bacterium]|nr:MAG: Hsp20/alpha crystallin family protein [Desulfobacterales bacterium]